MRAWPLTIPTFIPTRRISRSTRNYQNIRGNHLPTLSYRHIGYYVFNILTKFNYEKNNPIFLTLDVRFVYYLIWIDSFFSIKTHSWKIVYLKINQDISFCSFNLRLIFFNDIFVQNMFFFLFNQSSLNWNNKFQLQKPLYFLPLKSQISSIHQFLTSMF
mgnify:CR=1 FL=1